ncbi:MAG: signal peptidase II [Candidatus Omnitrophica bacterium]|nr:signal peptidase II [Candidatus Omnitrophota bacterium]
MSEQKGERKVTPQLVFYFLLFLGVFFVDQLLKKSVSSFFLPGEGFPVIKNIFHITLVFNKGIAFGMFQNIPLFFLIILILISIFSFLKYRPYTRGKKLAISLISAGTLSNLLDRIRFGYVVDYLDFRIWPVFNLADASITLGIVLFIWKIFNKEQEII